MLGSRSLFDWVKQFTSAFSRHKATCLFVGAAIVLCSINALACYLRTGMKSILIVGAALLVALLVCYGISSVLKRCGKISVNGVFVGFLAIQGLFYLFAFVPGAVPDEPVHFMSSYVLTNPIADVLLGAPSLEHVDETAGGIFGFLSTEMNMEAYAKTFEALSSASTDVLPSVWPIKSPSMDLLFPQVRFAPALGILIGRILHLSPLIVFYLGRLFNFAFFCVLAYLAVRVAPLGKRIIMMVCCLPMTLHVVTSYSYDAAIIGYGLLLTALCLRAIKGHGRIEKKLVIAIIVVTILLAPCKSVYCFIAFLVLAVPRSRFSSRRSELLFKGGVIVCSLVIAVGGKAAPFLQALLNAPPTNAGDTIETTSRFYTFSDALSDPGSFIALLVRTIYEKGDIYIRSILGHLGWFKISVPWGLLLVSFVLLLLSALPDQKYDSGSLSEGQRAMFLGVFCLVSLAVIVGMYVGWTSYGSRVIEGVQGRYFLPVLPLALLAFRGKTFVAMRDCTETFIYIAAFLNATIVLQVIGAAVAG